MIDSAVEKREMERKHATVQQRVSRKDVPSLTDLSLTMSTWSVLPGTPGHAPTANVSR